MQEKRDFLLSYSAMIAYLKKGMNKIAMKDCRLINAAHLKLASSRQGCRMLHPSPSHAHVKKRTTNQQSHHTSYLDIGCLGEQYEDSAEIASCPTLQRRRRLPTMIPNLQSPMDNS